LGYDRGSFPLSSTAEVRGAQDVHRESALPACANPVGRCKVKAESSTKECFLVIKAPVQICPHCGGTGWKSACGGSEAVGSINDRRVTRCDCQLRARALSNFEAARIPRRYEHCELTNYDTDFPGAHPSLAEALFVATHFANHCDPRGDKGL